MYRIIFALGILAFAFFSCVPQQKYIELEETLKYYKTEALASDSIRGTNQSLQNANDQTQLEYGQLLKEMEQLTATNISLNRNYQDIVQRYNSVVGENQRILATSSYETTNLEQELALRQTELDGKERRLSDVEYQLRNREAEVDRLEARGYNNQGGPTAYNQPDPRYNDLVAQKKHYTERLASLQNYFQRVLVGFPMEEVSMREDGGHIMLTLSKSLLFPQTDNDVHWKGRQALQQIAVVLRENADLEVQVTGHQYATNDAKYDWDLSVQRAMAVTNSLVTYGTDPANLAALGKGSNDPAVSVGDPRHQLLNSRTEIKVMLNYQPILEALEE